MRTATRSSLWTTIAALLMVSACAPASESDSATPAFPSSDGEAGAAGAAVAPTEELTILRLEPSATRVNHGGQVWLTCIASDPDGGPLSYEWNATGGSFSTTQGQVMTWVAPDRTGEWTVNVTVRNSSGDIATESVVIAVAENQPPVITSLQAAHHPVAMGESTAITCVATDADGDAITYSWRTDGGDLSGVGSIVTWFAPRVSPSHKTEYRITVVVDDGNGGTDLSEIIIDTVRILSAPDDVFTPIPRESGTVRSDGEELDDISWAGDDTENRGYRAFWSYDLSRLRGTSVAQATLEFKTGFIAASHDLDSSGGVVGEPTYKLWTQLRGLHIYQVNYGANALPDYNPERVLELTETALFEAPTEIDITDLVQNVATGTTAIDRFQVMAAFLSETNPNMFAEYISWTTVTLNVMYA